MFERKGIINFLHEQNIKSSIPKNENVFFIPILVNLENNELFLYNDNIFFSNWNINQLDRYLLKYLMPENDLEDFNIIKKNSMNIKKDIIEHLWKVIISDNTIDQYESNLVRRICGLIYFPDKESAEIKLRLINSK